MCDPGLACDLQLQQPTKELVVPPCETGLGQQLPVPGPARRPRSHCSAAALAGQVRAVPSSGHLLPAVWRAEPGPCGASLVLAAPSAIILMCFFFHWFHIIHNLKCTILWLRVYSEGAPLTAVKFRTRSSPQKAHPHPLASTLQPSATTSLLSVGGPASSGRFV